MQYSKIQNEIELLELKHKHEKKQLEVQHTQELRALKSSCTHKYDDGTSAKTTEGTQWDWYYACKICKTKF